MPYNYLFPKALGESSLNIIKNSIVVIDEGHNIDFVALDIYDVVLCKSEI